MFHFNISTARKEAAMCTCPHATPCRDGIFYCRKYKMYATARLPACILSELQAQWEDRLRMVPPIVREKEYSWLLQRNEARR